MSQLKEKLTILPNQPGCYLMKDRQGDGIIYVGKAKILRNRVRSYFTGSHDAKTQRLVSEIVDFEYIVTSSNIEALILEMNLIKKHDPKYNVMLKDDKTYPYLKITNEKHPRLLTTRQVKKDGGKYFGLIRMLELQMKQKNCSIAFIHYASVEICLIVFVCTITLVNALLLVYMK